MQLRNRMAPAKLLTDPRLLDVSREARLLASVLEHMAEDTGCTEIEPAQIRASAGMYLGTNEQPPPKDDVVRWLEELIEAAWLLPYTVSGMRLGYLKGFGERQQGPYVGVGRCRSTGEVAPHLPLPPGECVTLGQHEAWAKANKVRATHCEKPYTACAECSWLPTP